MAVSWKMLAYLFALAVSGTLGAEPKQAAKKASCPGHFAFQGLGNVSLVPTGWGSNMSMAEVQHGAVRTLMDSRTYFASTCTAGVYDNSQYLALDLRGKTLKYTTDLSEAGCGCNAAFYLTSMRQNERKSDCGDHYCDANNVCGVSCAEIDIQEGNRFSWHSTLHSSADHRGLGRGYGGGGAGWSGPRDWDAADFGPKGKCVDTNAPFEVSVSFPVDGQGKLRAMEVELSQDGHNCPLRISIGGYSAMAELDTALSAGMTPIVSYWSSDAMLWMDGKGMDNQGPCAKDHPNQCGESVRFYDFSVSPAFPPSTPPPTTRPPSTTAAAPAWHLGGPRLDLVSVRAFCVGAAAVVVVQVTGVLMAWAIWTIIKRPTETTETVNPVRSPLKNTSTGSSQSLLLLAEAGEGLTRPRMPRPSSRDVMVMQQ